MTVKTLRPEILVIGAGPGGSAAAWALAQSGHDVLLIDRADFPREKTCGDGLPPMAVGTLREMGLLPLVEAAGAKRIDYVQLTGPFGQSIRVRFDEYMGTGTYALVLPRVRLDDVVRRFAIEGGAEYLGQTRVDALEMETDAITKINATTPDGPIIIKPQHTIIAVGANMGFLRKAGFLTEKPVLIRAARAYYDNLPQPTDTYEFYWDPQLMPGYGWIFPTGGGRANIGVGVIPSFYATKQSTKALVEGFVARRMKGRLRGVELASPIRGYPLRIDFTKQQVAGRNWILIGEAAGLVNPVSGEGIDLALESGLIAADTMDMALRRNERDLSRYRYAVKHRFQGMFTGLNVLRDFLITPFFTDYAIWLMKQHRFFADRVLNIAQGFESPANVLRPRFWGSAMMPISPRWVRDKLSR